MNIDTEPLGLPEPVTAKFRPMTFRRLVRPFLDHKRLVLAAFLVPLIAVYVLTSFLPPSYQTTASILVEQRRVELGEIADVVTPRAIDSAFMSSQIEIMVSAPVLERAAIALGWLPEDGSATNDEVFEAVDGLSRTIDVRRRLNSFVIDVTAAGRSPEGAASAANAITDAYLAFQVDAQLNAAEQAVEWMQGEILALRERINVLNRRISDLRSDVLSEQASDLTTINDQIELLARQITEARVAASEAETEYLELVSVRDTSGPLAVAELLNVSEIDRQLSARANLSEELAAQSVDRGPSHPSVVELTVRINAIDEAVEKLVDLAIDSSRSDVNIQRQRVTALETAAVELQNRAIDFSPTQLSIDELTQELDANQDLYQALIERQSEIASQRLAISTDARVLAHALPPQDASGPRKILLSLLAAITGLMGASAFILIREAMSDRYESADDLMAETGLRVVLTGQVAPARLDIDTGPLQLQAPVLRPDNVDLVLFPGHGPFQDCMVLALAPLHSKTTTDKLSLQLFSGAIQRGRDAVIIDVTTVKRAENEPAGVFELLAQGEVHNIAVDALLNPEVYESTARSLKNIRKTTGLVIINLPAFSESALTPAWTGFADKTYVISDEARPKRAEVDSILTQISAYGGKASGIFVARA